MLDILKVQKATHDLKGKTLQVYLYLMRRDEPAGIREIQRELELSSPSVANYQIEKLMESGLVARDNHGRYYLLQKVKVPSLRGYVNMGRYMVPRFAFYAAFFTTLLASYVWLNLHSLNIFAVIFGSAGIIVFWYEALSMWRASPAPNGIDVYSSRLLEYNNRSEIIPYLVLGIVLVAVATAGFDMYSDVLKSLDNNQQDVIPSDRIPATIGNNFPEPDDRIDESVSLARQRVDFANSDNAFGPGVPLISGESFSALLVVLPLVGALAAGFAVYTIARIGCKQ